MGSIKIEPEIKKVKRKGRELELLLYSKSKIKKFNPSVLEIGAIRARSKQIEVIAGVFDLSKFTNFCKQVDPHLSVPKFLGEFLDWLFGEIVNEFTVHKYKQGVELYTKLPVFAKFLGDGVLFIWDTNGMDTAEMCNVLVGLRNICTGYGKEFVPKISKDFSDVPPTLRCGVARGLVCPIGNGRDYIGPCINIATRLQQLSSLPFCFSRRGLDFHKGMTKEVSERYIVKQVSIRGVGDKELVCVRKPEFEKLPKKERVNFKDV